MAEHTNGPWEIQLGLEPVSGKEYQRIAVSEGAIAFVARPEDAHLIAAAPDLLEAAESSSRILSDVLGNRINPTPDARRHAMKQVEELLTAAIRKAKGEA